MASASCTSEPGRWCTSILLRHFATTHARSRGPLAASKVAIRIVKGSNRSARGECEDAGCTLASSEHQRPAQTEGGRISEHDLEHFGTTAPNLEHFPAWPIQHLAPFSSGHDGV